MTPYDEHDEYECPAPGRPGRVARIVNQVSGRALAGAFLALLGATARLAHLGAGLRRPSVFARTPQAGSRDPVRDARPSADLGNELAVTRARRAFG